MRWGVAATVVLGLAVPALAQSPVQTLPYPGTSAGGNASSTIAVTNTFQLVFAAGSVPPAGGSSTARKGCTVINGGTNNMWVTEGLTAATATKAKAVTLSVGQAYYCGNAGGVTLIGEIDITGTAGESFYAAQW